MADIERIKADTEKYGGPFHPYKLDLGEGGTVEFSGLSLRDYFAGQALVGLLAHSFNDGSDFLHEIGPDAAAHQAYRMAGAMLAARKAGA